MPPAWRGRSPDPPDPSDAHRTPGCRRVDHPSTLGHLHHTGSNQPARRRPGRLHQRSPRVGVLTGNGARRLRRADGGRSRPSTKQRADGVLEGAVDVGDPATPTGRRTPAHLFPVPGPRPTPRDGPPAPGTRARRRGGRSGSPSPSCHACTSPLLGPLRSTHLHRPISTGPRPVPDSPAPGDRCPRRRYRGVRCCHPCLLLPTTPARRPARPHPPPRCRHRRRHRHHLDRSVDPPSASSAGASWPA